MAYDVIIIQPSYSVIALAAGIAGVLVKKNVKCGKSDVDWFVAFTR